MSFIVYIKFEMDNVGDMLYWVPLKSLIKGALRKIKVYEILIYVALIFLLIRTIVVICRIFPPVHDMHMSICSNPWRTSYFIVISGIVHVGIYAKLSVMLFLSGDPLRKKNIDNHLGYHLHAFFPFFELN